MVEEHELQKEKIQEDYNDKYWDQRYTIVQHRIPSFLQKMADKILSTGKNPKTRKGQRRPSESKALNSVCYCVGKYLNVVRECGRDVTCPDAKEVLYTLKERAYVEQIEKAYNYASKVLLDFLMEEKELVSRLRFFHLTNNTSKNFWLRVLPSSFIIHKHQNDLVTRMYGVLVLSL